MGKVSHKVTYCFRCFYSLFLFCFFMFSSSFFLVAINRDCPISAMGIVNFTTSSEIDVASSHFILGLKALHNFFYDVCKVEFEAAISIEPAFGMAYWGRALCSAQLVWNSENLDDSQYWLQLAKERNAFPGVMNMREQRYFESVVALNNGTASLESRKERYNAYLALLECIADDYPEDSTAVAFVVLARLAASSVASSSADARALQAAARAAAKSAFVLHPSFPGTLHYGIHAHDFPNSTIYEGGVEYAIQYPALVNETCHSLHMPSHIFDRMGRFDDGSDANRQSVAAADAFASSGALDNSGAVPLLDDAPPPNGDADRIRDSSHVTNSSGNNDDETTKIEGLPFSFNAGNLYHSLEYEQYERLQMCDFDGARRLLSRMAHATLQAMDRLPLWGTGTALGDASPLPRERFELMIGEAMYNATTFKQWELRMSARQILFSLALDFLMPYFHDDQNESLQGGIWAWSSVFAFFSSFLPSTVRDESSTQATGIFGRPEAPRSVLTARAASDWRAAVGASRPLPLSWAGSTVYSHAFYSPQSEAGAWSATALAALADAADVAAASTLSKPLGVSLVGSLRDFPAARGRDGNCGGVWTSYDDVVELADGCIADTVEAAVERIADVQNFYEDNDVAFEAANAKVLELEIRAVEKLLKGHIEESLSLAAEASTLENYASRNMLLPTSTTLFFLPADSIDGVVSGWAAAATTNSYSTRVSYLQRSQAAFSRCLEPLIRPNHTICLTGLARVSRALGDDETASFAYQRLLDIWGPLPPPGKAPAALQSACTPGIAEATFFLRTSGVPFKKEAEIAFIFFVILALGIMGFSYILRTSKDRLYSEMQQRKKLTYLIDYCLPRTWTMRFQMQEQTTNDELALRDDRHPLLKTAANNA